MGCMQLTKHFASFGLYQLLFLQRESIPRRTMSLGSPPSQWKPGGYFMGWWWSLPCGIWQRSLWLCWNIVNRHLWSTGPSVIILVLFGLSSWGVGVTGMVRGGHDIDLCPSNIWIQPYESHMIPYILCPIVQRMPLQEPRSGHPRSLPQDGAGCLFCTLVQPWGYLPTARWWDWIDLKGHDPMTAG